MVGDEENDRLVPESLEDAIERAVERLHARPVHSPHGLLLLDVETLPPDDAPAELEPVVARRVRHLVVRTRASEVVVVDDVRVEDEKERTLIGVPLVQKSFRARKHLGVVGHQLVFVEVREQSRTLVRALDC